ncbi:polyisoprenoid-binding protein [Rhodoferax sp. TH121]|uniref:YceI family protein n=1 Tax=Rhodoferax sp. TH121 TaxID=2022803 RepID=UPI000B967330|nr:YceI family protein [Rhodoferax sp. TH121]OYQ41818.1 polyisoprenoid-binding protein [Rhodoferax sp. TH121]
MTVSRLLVSALVAASALSCTLALAQQKLVPAQSEIVFVSKQMGVPVEGRFKKFDAQIAFDPAKPDTSKIAFTVDIASATLGAPESDAELPKATWFNTAKFPQATFQSTSIKGLGGGKFDVSGKLSIKGASRDVVVPVVLTQSGATTTATGTFPIKRLAFKIGENEWADTSMVADDVQVKFKLALTGVGKF